MGQIEVYEWLKFQRKVMRCDDYYTPRMVAAGLKDCGCVGSTNNIKVALHLSKLESDGYLEVVFPGKHNRWRRMFRLKTKYCKQ